MRPNTLLSRETVADADVNVASMSRPHDFVRPRGRHAKPQSCHPCLRCRVGNTLTRYPMGDLEMYGKCLFCTILVLIACLASSSWAGNWEETLRGRIWHHTSGTGLTSANPQIETWTAFCNNGTFLTYGKSCVPNRIASGFRCDPFSYNGKWQVQEHGQSALVSWQTDVSRGSYRIDVLSGSFYVNGREFKEYRRADC